MSKKDIVILLSIFLIAFFVRITLFSYLKNAEYYSGIKSGLIDMAHNLEKGKGFVLETEEGLKPVNQQLPGYPFLIALTFKIFGQEKEIFIQIIQIILSSLGVFLIFGIAKRFFDKKTAFLSSFLWSIWLPEARISIGILYDTIIVFAVLLAFYLFIKGVLENRIRFFILSAITIGFSSYICSQPILLPIFFGLVLWIYKRNWKIAFKRTILMLGIVFIILVPWGTRNHLIFNRFIFTKNVVWQGVWEGFGEFSNPFGAVLSDTVTYEQVSKEYPNIKSISLEYQEILKQKVIEALKTNPVWYFAMLPKRLLFMIFGPRDIGITSNILAKQWSRQMFFDTYSGTGNIEYAKWLFKNNPKGFLGAILLPVSLRCLLILSALFGIWITRKQWRYNILLISPLLYFYLGILPIHWEARYLIPGEFSLLIFSAVAIITIYSYTKNKIFRI